MAQILNSARARIAPLLSKAQSTVEPAYRLAEKHAVHQYDSIMKQNAEYVVKDPEAANKLLRQYVFTSLSRCGHELKGYSSCPRYICSRSNKLLAEPRIPAGISHCQKEYQQVSQKFAQGSHINMTEVLDEHTRLQ